MRIINRFTLILFFVLCVLTTIGILNFGYGLGNVIYIFPVILFTALHFFITRRLEMKKDDNYWTIIVFFYYASALFTKPPLAADQSFRGTETYFLSNDFSWFVMARKWRSLSLNNLNFLDFML